MQKKLPGLAPWQLECCANDILLSCWFPRSLQGNPSCDAPASRHPLCAAGQVILRPTPSARLLFRRPRGGFASTVPTEPNSLQPDTCGHGFSCNASCSDGLRANFW